MNRMIAVSIYFNSPLTEALKKLDEENSNQTVFVLNDENQLLGTITDGDIRRGFLRGLNIGSPLMEFCNRDFKYVVDDIDVRAIKVLKSRGIRVLPKLNGKGEIEKVFDLTRLNSILPIHAIIMAGGRGERLRPLTDKTPKSLLPLGNKPIIEHNIDRLISYGITNITVSVNYLADQIVNYLNSGEIKGATIDFIFENKPLGTIGSLSLIKNFSFDNVLVLNADLYTNINYEEFYLNYIDSLADAAVASIPYSVDIPYAIMELKDSFISKITEKPKNTYYANAGIYIFKKEVMQLLPGEEFFNATDLLEKIIHTGGKLIHSPITGFWIDIGKPDDYSKAMEIVRHI